MYLAPFNYDRFFERVFRDTVIAKQFLEDLLDVTIEEIEYLPRKNKITDDAAFVEFDYRCKINSKYVIVDMQQWYKQDVVKRFYLYFCNNTSLQLERMPTVNIPLPNGKQYKTKNYNSLEPSITIIWMADDTLGFREGIVTYSIFPEALHEFIRNESLWATNDLEKLLEFRNKVLKILENKTKTLDFLAENRLIYAFQPNIVANRQNEKYARWFKFAAITKNPENTKSDFESFENQPIFNRIMEKLKVNTLEKDDFEYITDYAEYERGVAAYNEKIRLEGYELAKDEFESLLQSQYMDLKKSEQARQKAEQEKQKSEQEVQNYQKKQLQLIKKAWQRGDSLEDMAAFFELEMPTLQRFIEHIKSMD